MKGVKALFILMAQFCSFGQSYFMKTKEEEFGELSLQLCYDVES